MSQIDDGGQAFPKLGAADDGMTLRDWFAGQALVGILATPSDLPAAAKGRAQSYSSELAYRYADAMIAERSKTN